MLYIQKIIKTNSVNVKPEYALKRGKNIFLIQHGMGINSIVLIKQVPDTKMVSARAMNPDGTLNRAALPAIFNPEDLNALELALQLRERYGGSVCVLTMGPPQAAEVLRESLYRGADSVILLTDKCFAASDTLATSYILSQAIRKIGRFDLILCGRQAIDGNTAQVGPQVAEKLELPQITYTEKVESIQDGKICAWRLVENGAELLEVPLPALLTVVDSASDPRPPSAKKIMRYKNAKVPSEITPDEAAVLKERGLLLTEWGADDIAADRLRCGLAGSPTKVQKIKKVVLKATDFKRFAPTDEGIGQLLQELIQDHTFD
jgi:electron transfer flavoprotein beta subunit